MKATPLSIALRFAAAVCLVVAVSGRVMAEDAPAAESAAPGKIGPGAPKAAKSAAKAPKAEAKGIALKPVAPVAAGVNVHDKVLEQCRLQTLLPQAIASHNSEVVLTEGGGAMKLEITIVDIHAPGGGWFSGPKWITVEGRLLQGKTVKGNFVAKETSMASATACGMLGKVVEVLGGDIATWLNAPAKDSHLGSAR